MSFLDWIQTPVEIHRNINELWTVATAALLVISLIIAWKRQYLKFGLFILFSGALVSMAWEFTLYFAGLRVYTQLLWIFPHPILEIIFHAFSETGAPVLLFLMIIDKLRLVNLEKFKDIHKEAA